jgi:hypothetical protein
MSVELVDRYLHAVRMLLPRKQRSDIERELAEEIHSQVEAKEAELGRAPSEHEVFAILKAFGHPALLALRYQEGRSLIGPRVFPLYWFSVKAIVAILAVLHIALPSVFILAMGEPARKIVDLFLGFPHLAIVALAWTTAMFAVLDTDVVRGSVEKALSGWKPGDLPALQRERPDPPRVPSLAGVLAFALCSVWWIVGLQQPFLLLGPAARTIAFGPVFYRLYVPMIALAAIGVLLGLASVARPGRAWHRYAALLLEAANLAMLFVVSKSGPWIVPAPGATGGPVTPEILAVVNQAATLGLAVAFVVSGVVFAFKCGKAWRLGSAAPHALAA